MEHCLGSELLVKGLGNCRLVHGLPKEHPVSTVSRVSFQYSLLEERSSPIDGKRKVLIVPFW